MMRYNTGNKRSVKQRAYNFGVWAEWLVSGVLICKGYRIVARRYKTPMGEIDIIAKNKRELLMVEVKARRNSDVSEVLSYHQMQRINKTALLFIAKHCEFSQHQVRFDLVIVHSVFSWKYIANAWEYNELGL